MNLEDKTLRIAEEKDRLENTQFSFLLQEEFYLERSIGWVIWDGSLPNILRG